MFCSNDITTPTSEEEMKSQGGESLRSIQVSRSTAAKRNEAGGTTTSSEGPANTTPCQWKRSKSQPSAALDSSMTDQGCSSIDLENGQSMNTGETTSECTDSGGAPLPKPVSSIWKCRYSELDRCCPQSLDLFVLFLTILGIGLMISILCVVILVSTYHSAVFGRKPPYNNNHSLVAVPFPDPTTYNNKQDLIPPTMSPTTLAVGYMMNRLQLAIRPHHDHHYHDDSSTNFTHSQLDRSSPQYQAIVWLSQHFPMDTTLEDLLLSTYYALATLYFTANGKSWRNNSGWMSPEEQHLCHWAGVTCIQTATSAVVGLNLSHNDLAGSLPTEIGLLTNITSLSLSQNHLMGPVPSELGYLQQLQQLHLDRNHFSGSLPVEIATNLPRLEEASLHGNDLVAGLRNFFSLQQYHYPKVVIGRLCRGRHHQYRSRDGSSQSVVSLLYDMLLHGGGSPLDWQQRRGGLYCTTTLHVSQANKF